MLAAFAVLALQAAPGALTIEPCACVPAPNAEARLARAEAAFHGVPVHSGVLGDDVGFTDFEFEPGPLAARVRVDPEGRRLVRVRHALDPAACGVSFDPAARYLVLVSQSRRDGVWETGACLMPSADGADGVEPAFERAESMLRGDQLTLADVLQDAELGREPLETSADVAGAVDVEGGPDR